MNDQEQRLETWVVDLLTRKHSGGAKLTDLYQVYRIIPVIWYKSINSIEMPAISFKPGANLLQFSWAISFKPGANLLQFSWANTLIDPTSVQLRFVTHADKLELVSKGEN